MKRGQEVMSERVVVSAMVSVFVSVIGECGGVCVMICRSAFHGGGMLVS